ncbi:ORF_2 [Adoxophyes orana granulovirus]|uniref:ORF_2 n=1 Tax=Adoxophyes orana granulovirus TaxID=170617 RepID=Q91B73_GVAO|nr:ORF_2 [Adoxophyes orana granulovirus]AAL02083.1 unknown [Adoxophyes orana granulovirus]AAP85639.1 ORF_2 [Adoxophyes orana granulovirus]AJA91642.1 PP78/83 [Adoxophyes orana granulovirus]
MDLLDIVRNSNFKVDARDAIPKMKWNASLKRKISALQNNDNTDLVGMNLDEVVEFLDTLYYMIIKSPRLTTTTKIDKTTPSPPVINEQQEINLIDIETGDKSESFA